MNGYIDISHYTTFGVPAWVKGFHTFDSITSLRQLLTPELKKNNLLILGGGSNMLFTKPFEGIVLKNEIVGIEVIGETEQTIDLKVNAGENWHEFVQYTVEKGLGGIENLSLIPGSVGASPIQNIGAYGVEIKDVFVSLEAFEISSGQVIHFDLESCKFGYRESIFKHSHKGQYIILNVTYRLQKTPVLNTKYGAIDEQLSKMGIETPTVKDVSEAVIEIRESKLPNPKEVGNAGSFFKNPIITKDLYTEIQKQHPTAPCYVINSTTVKIPAGWLIEQAGWKGYKEAQFGVHPKQALVLVNYGNADGASIFDLSDRIIADIQDKFKITLEREVNVF